MNIKQLKEMIADLPDDTRVLVTTDDGAYTDPYTDRCNRNLVAYEEDGLQFLVEREVSDPPSSWNKIGKIRAFVLS